MLEVEKKKRIVICADDFGMNRGVDEAVLHLAAIGRLSATSCLVSGPAFRADAAALAASGLQTGLHLNFTEALDDAGGLHLPVSQLILRAYLHRLDAARLRAQVAAQLDGFEDAMGRAPDFVDGHQHVHQLPQIRRALLAELERRYAASRPWLRYTGLRRTPGLPAALLAKAGVIELLGARRFARMARRRGYPLNPGFLGVYGFQGGEAGYRALLQRWLAHARGGDVLMCHPAARACEGDGLGGQRVAEYRVLASDETQGWLARYGIALR